MRRRLGVVPTLAWVEADAEALPFADGDFDVVVSCMGMMLAAAAGGRGRGAAGLSPRAAASVC